MQNLEGKVLELEDKVIDLESDNKGLKDDKDKLVVEKEGLLEQISVSISIESAFWILSTIRKIFDFWP
jgi:hypothetical protein